MTTRETGQNSQNGGRNMAAQPARDRPGTLRSNPAFQGDSILFHGSKIPAEVRKMVPYLASVKVEKFRKLLEGILFILSGFIFHWLVSSLPFEA